VHGRGRLSCPNMLLYISSYCLGEVGLLQHRVYRLAPPQCVEGNRQRSSGCPPEDVQCCPIHVQTPACVRVQLVCPEEMTNGTLSVGLNEEELPGRLSAARKARVGPIRVCSCICCPYPSACPSTTGHVPAAPIARDLLGEATRHEWPGWVCKPKPEV